MTYVPLAYMGLLVVCGPMALANIDPVPRPPVQRPLVMPLFGRHGLTLFGYPPVATADAGPDLFPDVTGGIYTAPATPRSAPGMMTGRYPVGRWPAPPRPVFARQSPTPATGEHAVVSAA